MLLPTLNISSHVNVLNTLTYPKFEKMPLFSKAPTNGRKLIQASKKVMSVVLPASFPMYFHKLCCYPTFVNTNNLLVILLKFTKYNTIFH
jgi:hypothetical protein